MNAHSCIIEVNKRVRNKIEGFAEHFITFSQHV